MAQQRTTSLRSIPLDLDVKQDEPPRVSWRVFYL